MANPGLTLALSAGQTGTGAQMKLLDLIQRAQRALANAPRRQPMRLRRPRERRCANDAHVIVTDGIALPVRNVLNKVTNRNRLLRQRSRSSSKSRAGPISQRTTGRQFQRSL